MKPITKKSALLGFVMCIVLQAAGCGTSGTGSGSDKNSATETKQTTESTAEQVADKAAEMAALKERETKPEESDIMSVTAWSVPDLSDFHEIFYPGFELETEIIDGRSYRKFVADNGWYVIDKSKNAWEKDCIIEIGREDQSKEYPICDAIGGIGLDTSLHIAYIGNGAETAVAPRLFWSDVTGDGQEDICIRLDYFDSENWLQGRIATCNLYVYDCARDNFITIEGNSLYEMLKNEITISDTVVGGDGSVSLSVTESGEKHEFTLADTVGDDRVLESCGLDEYAQYITVRDGQICMGYWIRITAIPESDWDGVTGAILDGPLVYKTLEYNAEKGCFEPVGKTQTEIIDTFRYADTVDFKSEYWENYINEHKEQ